jgi:hypothetical protein
MTTARVGNGPAWGSDRDALKDGEGTGASWWSWETRDAPLSPCPVSLRGEKDWKHCGAVIGIGSRQFPNKIVESRPRVVNAVADEQGPFDGWDLRRLDQARDVPFAIIVAFEGDDISLSGKEVADAARERLEVTSRPS